MNCCTVSVSCKSSEEMTPNTFTSADTSKDRSANSAEIGLSRKVPKSGAEIVNVQNVPST